MHRTFSAIWAAVLLAPGGWLAGGEPAPAKPAPQTQSKAIMVTVPDGLQPAIEEVPGLGTVDWTQGVALAVGQAQVKRPRLKMMMLRMAKIRAMRNSLTLLGQMRVDSTQDLKHLADERRTINIKGFISQFAVAEEKYVRGKVKNYWQVTLRVPFYGVKGLSVFLYDHVAMRPLPQRLREQPWRREQLPPHLMPPIIVIDARGVDVQAVLYPKLADNLGTALLDVNSRDQAVAVNEGVATFVTPADDEDDEALWRRLRGSGRTVCYYRLHEADTQLACAVPLAGPLTEVLMSAARRRIRRRRLVVKAAKATGKNKGTLVLSAESAKKLAANPEAADVLKKGRVYIVVDSRKGAIQGRAPTPDSTPGRVGLAAR